MTDLTWSTACLDWEQRITEGRSLVPFDPLFPDAAEAAMTIYRDLRIVDMPGRPTIGQVCRPWVFDLPRALFGSYDQETGRRLISDYMLLVSKKNWKSGAAASIMLTALCENWRDSAEFLIVAPTVEIANNSFGPAADMVRADPEMWVEHGGFLRIQPSFRMITDTRNGSTLKVIAADSQTVGGKKASGIFIDELWLFGKRPGAEDMFREVTGGLASRKEGFVIYATTQSDEPPAGIFRQKLNYFRDVRDGKVRDPRSLGILYEYPEKMLKSEAWRDRSTWFITNPNLGASVDEEFIERKFVEADQAGGESRTGFLAKHLNVEIGLALRNDRWVGADYWEPAGAERVTKKDLLEWSDVITIGIDGGGLDDLLGFAAIGRHRETRAWLHWGHAWCHTSALERRKSEAPRYRDFERDGDLTIVSHLPEDLDQVADIVAEFDASGLLAAVGLDQIGIGGIIDALAERGIVNAEGQPPRIVGISQGYKLTGAIKTVERKLNDGTFLHGGSGLMAYAVGNARVEPRGNAVVITKQISGTAKIDPLMALFNAAALMSTNPEPRNAPSVYNDDTARPAGLLIL